MVCDKNFRNIDEHQIFKNVTPHILTNYKMNADAFNYNYDEFFIVEKEVHQEDDITSTI